MGARRAAEVGRIADVWPAAVVLRAASVSLSL
jgi:hypothetical protein